MTTVLSTSGNSGAGTEFQKGKPGSCRAVCPAPVDWPKKTASGRGGPEAEDTFPIRLGHLSERKPKAMFNRVAG